MKSLQGPVGVGILVVGLLSVGIAALTYVAQAPQEVKPVAVTLAPTTPESGAVSILNAPPVQPEPPLPEPPQIKMLGVPDDQIQRNAAKGLLLQLATDGSVVQCWTLPDVDVTWNEGGVYWASQPDPVSTQEPSYESSISFLKAAALSVVVLERLPPAAYNFVLQRFGLSSCPGGPPDLVEKPAVNREPYCGPSPIERSVEDGWKVRNDEQRP